MFRNGLVGWLVSWVNGWMVERKAIYGRGATKFHDGKILFALSSNR